MGTAGVELNLRSTDDTWALTIGKLIRSCGMLLGASSLGLRHRSWVTAALLASEGTDWGLWGRGSLSLSTKPQVSLCQWWEGIQSSQCSSTCAGHAKHFLWAAMALGVAS